MRLRQALGAVLLGSICLGFGGCIAVGGSERKCTPPTLGQQLIDLKSARDGGAMTDQEYALAKDKLLRQAP